MKLAGRTITNYGLALLAFTLIGLFLRIYQLGTQSIWYDEAYSIWVSKMNISQMMATAPATDLNPPLYLFILHYWIMIFGTSEFAVRLLSALFGVLAIPMIYVVGRRLFNEEAGLVGALILAVSWLNIWSSQEARTYSLMVLLALLSTYFFLRLLKQNRVALSAAYMLSTAFLVYAHYFGWFVVIAQNIYVLTLWLLSRQRAPKLRRWVPLQAIVLALYIPWIAIMTSQISLVAAINPHPLPTLATIIRTFLTYSGMSWALLVLFLGLSVLSFFAYQRVGGSVAGDTPMQSIINYVWEVRLQDPAPVYFLAMWVLSLNLIPLIMSYLITPIYVDKYTITASVALYLLAAKGVSNIRHKYTKLAVIGIIVILSLSHLPGYYFGFTRLQAREATQFVDANAESGDLVLVSRDFDRFASPFDYYNNRTDVGVKPIFIGSGLSANDKQVKTEELQSDLNGYSRVWFFDANTTTALKPSDINFTLSILDGSYVKIYVQSYIGYDVYLYEKPA